MKTAILSASKGFLPASLGAIRVKEPQASGVNNPLLPAFIEFFQRLIDYFEKPEIEGALLQPEKKYDHDA